MVKGFRSDVTTLRRIWGGRPQPEIEKRNPKFAWQSDVITNPGGHQSHGVVDLAASAVQHWHPGCGGIHHALEWQ